MRRWENEWDAVLVESFPTERNADIARRLGCGERSVVRHARMLGLEKGEAFREKVKGWAASGSRRYCEYMRITGRKIVRRGVCGKPFEKGHRFEAEVEERRVKALRDRAWDERVRLIRGFARKTGWNMKDYGK